MITLGIESSCDETAIAIINDNHKILAHQLITQYKEHSIYGGVVPEIASRAHLEYMDKLIKQSLIDANMKIEDIDVFASGCGPGLIGGLIVGVNMAKTLAFTLQKPFVAVNHLEAHALMPMFFEPELKFPYLLLLASGGHTQILIVHDVGNYTLLGTTIDDACGECFDKVAKMLGWDYMGGKDIEKFAQKGNPTAFNFPRPLLHSKDLNFSFSGLKTAINQTISKLETPIDDKTKSDICASFQSAICDIIEKKIKNAIKQTSNLKIKYIVASGGVARNQKIREILTSIANKNNMKTIFAEPKYCSDNGVMIAFAGEQNYKKGKISNLDITPRPRWPLEELKNE